MSPTAELSKTIRLVVSAYLFARDAKSVDVCVCMRWAQSSTLEMIGRSGGDPLLVERERICKGVAEAVLLHCPPPKREVDAHTCGGGEV